MRGEKSKGRLNRKGRRRQKTIRDSEKERKRSIRGKKDRGGKEKKKRGKER